MQKLYDQADVIITNPPFSLLREFVSNLFLKNKKFLIIGTKILFARNNLFPLFKNNFLKTGYTSPKSFFHYDSETKTISIKKFGNVGWFTNLDTSEKEDLQIFKKYVPENYEFVDELKNTINITKLKDIPYDFEGNMAFPIIILDKKYQDLIEIIEIRQDLKINNEFLFARIIGRLIRK